MAGDWIKMRNDLADDPAVIGMASRLGVDEFSIVGRLHRFWAWADRHSSDGHASGVTKAWVDRYVQCDGFADALETCGWLCVVNGGITVPKFDRHNGESAKKRGLATERKRKQRSSDDLSHQMSRTESDKSVTREEKRREEKENPPTPLARGGPADSRFPEFWDSWPSHKRKVARPQCQKKWLSAGCEAIASRVLESLEAHKASEDWRKDAGEFIPAPLVWLNQRRWESPVGAAEPETAGGGFL